MNSIIDDRSSGRCDMSSGWCVAGSIPKSAGTEGRGSIMSSTMRHACGTGCSKGGVKGRGNKARR
jgi:hypothetical protein